MMVCDRRERTSSQGIVETRDGFCSNLINSILRAKEASIDVNHAFLQEFTENVGLGHTVLILCHTYQLFMGD